MEDWKNTKCGTCIIQRQKPICNSCLGHQFYKPMSNADKIRNMSDEELAEFFNQFDSICCMCLFQVGCSNIENNRCEKGILQWLQSEVKGSD